MKTPKNNNVKFAGAILLLLLACSIVQSTPPNRIFLTESVENKLSQLQIVEIEQTLRMIGYQTGKIDGILDKATRKSVNEYAKRNSLTVKNGIVTDGIHRSLLADRRMLQLSPVLNSFFELDTTHWSDGIITAEGVWETDTIGDNLLDQRDICISCSKERGLCVESIAHVSYQMTPIALGITQSFYSVIEWSDTLLVARNEQCYKGCVYDLCITKDAVYFKCSGKDGTKKTFALISGYSSWIKHKNRLQRMKADLLIHHSDSCRNLLKILDVKE